MVKITTTRLIDGVPKEVYSIAEHPLFLSEFYYSTDPSKQDQYTDVHSYFNTHREEGKYHTVSCFPMAKECRLRFGDWNELFDKKGNVLKDFNARLIETISQEDEDLVLDTNYKNVYNKRSASFLSEYRKRYSLNNLPEKPTEFLIRIEFYSLIYAPYVQVYQIKDMNRLSEQYRCPDSVVDKYPESFIPLKSTTKEDVIETLKFLWAESIEKSKINSFAVTIEPVK